VDCRCELANGADKQQAGDASLYDEVSENVYKSIVQDRLQRDDFVEDDGVDGYNDDGMDIFEGEVHESEEERETKRE
jgi:DNA polymerase alpha subunit A